MLIMNTWDEVIVGKFGDMPPSVSSGQEILVPPRTYVLQPHEVVEVSDAAGEHLLRHFGMRGLVRIKLGDDLEEASGRGRRELYRHACAMIEKFQAENRGRAAQGIAPSVAGEHLYLQQRIKKQLEAEFGSDLMREPIPAFGNADPMDGLDPVQRHAMAAAAHRTGAPGALAVLALAFLSAIAVARPAPAQTFGIGLQFACFDGHFREQIAPGGVATCIGEAVNEFDDFGSTYLLDHCNAQVHHTDGSTEPVNEIDPGTQTVPPGEHKYGVMVVTAQPDDVGQLTVVLHVDGRNQTFPPGAFIANWGIGLGVSGSPLGAFVQVLRTVPPEQPRVRRLARCGRRIRALYDGIQTDTQVLFAGVEFHRVHARLSRDGTRTKLCRVD